MNDLPGEIITDEFKFGEELKTKIFIFSNITSWYN